MAVESNNKISELNKQIIALQAQLDGCHQILKMFKSDTEKDPTQC